MNPSSKLVLIAGIVLIALSIFFFVGGQIIGGIGAAFIGVLGLIGHIGARKK